MAITEQRHELIPSRFHSEGCLAIPPFSAVVNADQQIGYEAAVLLDTLVLGHPAPQQELYIPPQGIQGKYRLHTRQLPQSARQTGVQTLPVRPAKARKRLIRSRWIA